MYLTLIKLRRLLARWPAEVWRCFCAPIFETGQMIGLAVAVLGTFIALTQTPLSGWASKLSEWVIPVQAFGYVLLAWGLISMIAAPFRVVASDKKRGHWQGHHYIYREPILVFSGRFEHKGGIIQTGVLDFSDAEPNSFVFCEITATPKIPGRVFVRLNGGKPSPHMEISIPQPRQLFLSSEPGSHVGFRLPSSKSATVYVRMLPETAPLVIRVYCVEFFVGKNETEIGKGPWVTAMVSLQKARSSGKLEAFIAEHEADPKGDADKLDALLKRPVQESGSEAQPASPRGASDD